jgi:hypothetical protein
MKCKCKLTSTTPYLGPDLFPNQRKYLEFVEGIYYDYDVIEEHGLGIICKYIFKCCINVKR